MGKFKDFKKKYCTKHGSLKKKYLKELLFIRYDDIEEFKGYFVCLGMVFKTREEAENYRKASLYDGYF